MSCVGSSGVLLGVAISSTLIVDLQVQHIPVKLWEQKLHYSFADFFQLKYVRAIKFIQPPPAPLEDVS